MHISKTRFDELIKEEIHNVLGRPVKEAEEAPANKAVSSLRALKASGAKIEKTEDILAAALNPGKSLDSMMHLSRAIGVPPQEWFDAEGNWRPEVLQKIQELRTKCDQAFGELQAATKDDVTFEKFTESTAWLSGLGAVVSFATGLYHIDETTLKLVATRDDVTLGTPDLVKDSTIMQDFAEFVLNADIPENIAKFEEVVTGGDIVFELGGATAFKIGAVLLTIWAASKCLEKIVSHGKVLWAGLKKGAAGAKALAKAMWNMLSSSWQIASRVVGPIIAALADLFWAAAETLGNWMTSKGPSTQKKLPSEKPEQEKLDEGVMAMNKIVELNVKFKMILN